ncbi:MAG TPA: calcium-binding protein [Pseudonocardiaceae bacterium]
MRASVLFAAVAAGLVVLVAPPSGAVADPVGTGAVVSFNVNLITVSAYPGRANNIQVSRDATGWLISERGALGMAAGTGCAAAGTGTVRCPLSGVTALRVNAGDWDDRVVVLDAITTQLNGGDGNDTLTGGSGQDFLVGGYGADVTSGGAGLDTVSYEDHGGSVRASIDGVSGDDGEAGEHDTIATDVENLWGGSGWDTLTGSDARNFLYGLGGYDSLRGAGGNDHLDGGEGNDTLDGGPGADSMFGHNGTDTADYSARTAAVSVTIDSVSEDGEAGERDRVEPSTENVTGGAGGDTLIGNELRNVLRGGAGDDWLFGRDGDDSLLGEDGGDRLYGEAGDDWLPGDRSGGPLGTDVVVGGSGVDSTAYEGRTVGVIVLLDGLANDGQYGEADHLLTVEKVTGGRGDDLLLGGPGAETLSGGDGRDYLDGAGGADVLLGGYGEDTLYGLDGDDRLDGGGGVDDLDGEGGTDRCEAADGGLRAGCELSL